MLDHPTNNLTKRQIWWLAIRPRTLPASTAGVVTGTAVAILAGKFSWLPALAALAVALLLQIASNLANDVFDFEHGKDTSARVGPVRVTAARLLTPAQVKRGLACVVILAALIGLYLAFVTGWPVILIGLAAIGSAILYTGGPYPLGYHGFGDLFVFLFFGLAAVTGTYYVQAGSTAPAAWLMSIPLGLLVVNLLVVNNLRDIHTDAAVGKRTLAVRLGVRNTKLNYLIWFILAYLAIPVYILFQIIPSWSMLVCLSIPEGIRLLKMVFTREGRDLNPALAGTGRLALIYAVLFLISVLLAVIL
jgi:1,4-dihydroxy-2-naphthoate octaprenyltransferase